MEIEENDANVLSSDEDEAHVDIPLLKGLDLRDLYDGKPVDIEVASCDERNAETGPNMYTYTEESLVNVNYDGVEDDDSSEDLTQFQKLAKTMANLTTDGCIKKKVMKAGDGVAVPEGATVTIHFNAYVEENEDPYDSSRLRNKPMVVNLETGGLIPGLKTAIQSMTKTEVSHFLIDPSYAYGPMGCPPRVPANATIYFKIELLDFVDDFSALQFKNMNEEEREQATFQQRIQAANGKINSGNHSYKQHNYRQAISHYKRAVDILDNCHLKNDEEEAEWRKGLIRANSNIATCWMKLETYPRAITYARKVLDHNADHAKSLYTIGKAKSMLNDFEGAEYYLKKAQSLNPKDPLIQQAFYNNRERRDEAKIREKELCRKMLKLPKKEVPKVNEVLKKEINDFINNFQEDEEINSIKYPRQVKNEEIDWITKHVENLNIKVVTYGNDKDTVKLTFVKGE